MFGQNHLTQGIQGMLLLNPIPTRLWISHKNKLVSIIASTIYYLPVVYSAFVINDEALNVLTQKQFHRFSRNFVSIGDLKYETSY